MPSKRQALGGNNCLDAFYLLLAETPRMVPHHSGRVGLEFTTVCATPAYASEIAAARPDLASEASAASEIARALNASYYGPHYPCCTEEEWFRSYMEIQKKASREGSDP
jgi:hypothetical protein